MISLINNNQAVMNTQNNGEWACFRSQMNRYYVVRQVAPFRFQCKRYYKGKWLTCNELSDFARKQCQFVQFVSDSELMEG